MRLSVLPLAMALAAAASPLAAQPVAPEYDANAPVTIEGVADTVVWSMAQGKLRVKPNAGSQLWEIALPDTRTLLNKGVSAEVLARDTPVKVRALKSKDPACNPYCQAQAAELTVNGRTYALANAPG